MPGLLELGAVCGAPAGAGQQPPPPAQPPPQPQPPPQCDILRGTLLADGLPMPGSDAFCLIADDVGKAFQPIGDVVADWVDALNPVDAIAVSLGIPLAGGAVGSLVNGFIGLWNETIKAFQRLGNDAVGRFTGILRTSVAVTRCLTLRCNPSAYLGVWSLWQLVRVLRDLEVGWELGPKLTLRLELDFPGVDEWLRALMRYYCPSEPPSADEATEAWLRNTIGEEQRDCVWKLAGRDPGTFTAFAMARRERVDWREAIQFIRRKGGGQGAEEQALRERGFVQPDDIGIAREMYDELPGIADHLHWLQRNVDDADYVQKYGLLDGFATDAEIQSIPKFATYVTVVNPGNRNFWATYGRDLTSLGMRMEYAAYHYAAHWIMPSPEQMKVFLYRSDEIAAATGQPFTLDDLNRILAEQDYSALTRKWFTATAYQVPAISYIKGMYQQGVINDAQLTTYHARLGYAPQDAANFAAIDKLQRDRMRAAASGGWTTHAASTAFATGQMTADEHTAHFTHLGYTQAEAAEARQVALQALKSRIVTRARSRALSVIATSMNTALDVGVLTPQQGARMLQDAGWPKDEADSYANAQDAIAGAKRIRRLIGFVGKRVLDGSITLPVAGALLGSLGLPPVQVNRYVQEWTLQQSHRVKRRAWQQVSGDMAAGRMTLAEGAARLANMGYTDPDIKLFMEAAQGRIADLRAKQQAAAQRSVAARAKALARLAKEAQATKKQIVSSMVRDMPVSRLEKWLKLGYISKHTFTERMRLYGFSEDDIALRIREKCESKGAACTDQQAAIPPVDGAGAGAGRPAK